MPLETIRNAIPQAGPPAGESYGGFRVYVAPPPMAGASALAGWKGQPGGGGAAPVDSGGIAGLAAIDDKGNAAACSLSMGQLFGARIVVPGTGILLGRAREPSDRIDGVAVSVIATGAAACGCATSAGGIAGVAGEPKRGASCPPTTPSTSPAAAATPTQAGATRRSPASR